MYDQRRDENRSYNPLWTRLLRVYRAFDDYHKIGLASDSKSFVDFTSR